jgi:outer membrane protein OmpA-like peptidoglycan-associated protein
MLNLQKKPVTRSPYINRHRVGPSHYLQSRFHSISGFFPLFFLTALFLLYSPSQAWAEQCDKAEDLYQLSLQTKDDESKKRFLQKALKLCRFHVETLSDLGQLTLKQGHTRKAIYYLDLALFENPDHTISYAILGDAYYKNKQYHHASKAYKNFLKQLSLSPNSLPTANPDQLRLTYQNRLKKVAELDRAQKKERGANRHKPEQIVSAASITRALTGSTSRSRSIVLCSSPSQSRSINFTDNKKCPKPPQAKIDIKIYFDTGSDQLQTNSIPQLEQVSAALSSGALGKSSILIQGHTDSTGSTVRNQQLSLKRAERVRQFLIENHVDIALEVEGMGENSPVASNETKKGRAINRRVTFINQGN